MGHALISISQGLQLYLDSQRIGCESTKFCVHKIAKVMPPPTEHANTLHTACKRKAQRLSQVYGPTVHDCT
jgi:hypothetical protein